MTKLIDIKGYWNMASVCYDFNDKDMWEGQILLQEDGWFEEIAIDPNSSYKEDRFIFGVYSPDKVIELFKFTPLRVNSPFVFHGRKTALGYDGSFETISFFGLSPCGVSRMTTQSAEVVRGNVSEEEKKLEARIQRYKSQIMDEAGEDFYTERFANRKMMMQLILSGYEKQTATEKESGKNKTNVKTLL